MIDRASNTEACFVDAALSISRLSVEEFQREQCIKVEASCVIVPTSIMAVKDSLARIKVFSSVMILLQIFSKAINTQAC